MSTLCGLQGKKLLRRNPSGASKLDGSVGIELGRVLELEVGGQVVRTGRARPPLLWFPAWKALVFFEGVKRSSDTEAKLRKLSEGQATGRARSKFDQWAQREATKARDVEFSGGVRKWYAAGVATRIDYWSDKWGEKAEYTHDFSKGVRVYILAGRKSAMWVVRGGKMTVTERGIVR